MSALAALSYLNSYSLLSPLYIHHIQVLRKISLSLSHHEISLEKLVMSGVKKWMFLLCSGRLLIKFSG